MTQVTDGRQSEETKKYSSPVIRHSRTQPCTMPPTYTTKNGSALQKKNGAMQTPPVQRHCLDTKNKIIYSLSQVAADRRRYWTHTLSIYLQDAQPSKGRKSITINRDPPSSRCSYIRCSQEISFHPSRFHGLHQSSRALSR